MVPDPNRSASPSPGVAEDDVGVQVRGDLVVDESDGITDVTVTVSNTGEAGWLVPSSQPRVEDGIVLYDVVLSDNGDEAPATADMLSLPTGTQLELPTAVLRGFVPDADPTTVCVLLVRDAADAFDEAGMEARIAEPVDGVQVCGDASRT